MKHKALDRKVSDRRFSPRGRCWPRVYPHRCDLLYTGTEDNRRDRVVVRKGESFLYYTAVTSHLGGRKSIRLRPRGVGRYVVRRTLGGGGSVKE